MIRAGAGFALLAGASLLVSGCAVGATAARENTPPRHFTASAEHSSFEWFLLPVEVGKERKIWARHGLAPEFVPVAASAAQLKEQVDSGIKIGLVNTAEVLLARSQGTPVKIVAGYFGETGAKIYVKADAPWTTAKDLDARKIGILANTHTSFRAVSYMNAKLGMKSEPIVLGSLANNVGALKSGQIDAFYSAEGAASTLVQSGEIRVLLPLADIYPKPYTAVVVWATDDLIERSPDLVAAFVAAMLETVKYIKEYPADASELLARRLKVPKAAANRAVEELNKVLTQSGRGSGRDLVAAVEGNRRFTVESGFAAAAAVGLDEVVDPRFLP